MSVSRSRLHSFLVSHHCQKKGERMNIMAHEYLKSEICFAFSFLLLLYQIPHLTH